MIRLLHGDMLAELPKLAADSFHACVTDPPYHLASIVKRFGATSLADDTQTSERSRRGVDGYARAAKGFMGKQWDGGDIAFRAETWAHVYRVLKPGAFLLAFGGTRNAHRMVCAIEDTGFEIRDSILRLYGSGFPKSHNLSGEWQGWGTALKPAHEPICVARKPLSERSVAANVLKHGTGAINVDACRVEAKVKTGWAGAEAGAGTWNADNCGLRKAGDARPVQGRWPANVAHDGSAEVLQAFPDSNGQAGAIVGSEPSATGDNGIYGHFDRVGFQSRGDSGSAARFFYTAKADKGDRADSKHPTVKPVDLMCWLVTLVCPPGGQLLDPFAGSGTTGEGCMLAGFDCTLIERDPQHAKDIEHRIKRWSGLDQPLFAEVATS